jgi:hypothetical protein
MTTRRRNKNKKEKIITTINEEFSILRQLIGEYKDAAIADSWKGGGDREDITVLECELALALAKLDSHINKMERDYG